MSDTNSIATVSPDTQGDADTVILRFYREGDIPAIVKLINDCYEADGFGTPATVESLTANYIQPLSDPPRQVILAENNSGEIIGVARAVSLDDKEGSERLYQLRLLTHPTARGNGLGSRLARRMMDNIRANEQPGTLPMEKVSLLSIVRAEDEDSRTLLEEIGLRDIRHGWTMERSLDVPVGEPKVVEGVTIRNYRRPEDHPALREAYNTSFIDHFEFHALTQEMVDYQMDRPSVHPELSWVGEIDAEPGKLAGFCISSIIEQENARTGNKEGWIDLLGTVRGWRGVGLGKSLLLRGLRSLKEAGMETALLGVDSESPTGANRLYESVGFTVRHHEILYKCSLLDAHL